MSAHFEADNEMTRVELLEMIRAQDKKQVTKNVTINWMEHHATDGQFVLPEIVLSGEPIQQGFQGPIKRLASPYRGVSFHSCTQKWRARIKHGSKSEHLGYFTSDVEAARAYNEAAKKIHGNGAQVNEGVDDVLNGFGVVSRRVDTVNVPYDGVTFFNDKTPRSKMYHQTRTSTPKSNKVISFQKSTTASPAPEYPENIDFSMVAPMPSDYTFEPENDYSMIVPMPVSESNSFTKSQVQDLSNLKLESEFQDFEFKPTEPELEFIENDLDDFFLQLWMPEQQASEPRCGMKRCAEFEFDDVKPTKRIQAC